MPVIYESVRTQEPTGARPRRQEGILSSSHYKEQLALARREGDDCDRERALIVVKRDEIHRFGLAISTG